MKTTINLFLCAVFLLFSCKKDDEKEKDKTEHTDQRLKGTWRNESGTSVYTGDEKGVYLQSTSNSAWLSAIEGKFVNYGVAYIKDLEKKNDNEYTCAMLWFTRTNDIVSEVRYSTKSTIKFSLDNKRIDISSYSPFDNSFTTTALYKD